MQREHKKRVIGREGEKYHNPQVLGIKILLAKKTQQRNPPTGQEEGMAREKGEDNRERPLFPEKRKEKFLL